MLVDILQAVRHVLFLTRGITAALCALDQVSSCGENKFSPYIFRQV